MLLFGSCDQFDSDQPSPKYCPYKALCVLYVGGRLLLSLSCCPKVITLNGFHCNNLPFGGTGVDDEEGVVVVVTSSMHRLSPETQSRHDSSTFGQLLKRTHSLTVESKVHHRQPIVELQIWRQSPEVKAGSVCSTIPEHSPWSQHAGGPGIHADWLVMQSWQNSESKVEQSEKSWQ